MNRIAITNPEELFEEVDLKESAKRKANALNVAKLLMDSDPVVLAGTIARLSADELPGSVDRALANMLARKVCECTPDQLNNLVIESRASGVWPLVKPHVLKRNEEVARHLTRHENLKSVQNFLEAVATADTKWLPGTIYDAAGEVLSKIASQSDSIQELNDIADEARKWRMPQLVLPAVRMRQCELEDSIRPHYRNGGYPMRRGSHHLLVDSVTRALYFLSKGYDFIEAST